MTNDEIIDTLEYFKLTFAKDKKAIEHFDKAIEIIEADNNRKDVISQMSEDSDKNLTNEETSMSKEEKLLLLIDELEDIRCDNFDINTDEDRTLKEAIRIIRIIKETKHNICESCRKFDSSDRYCRLLQINHLPEEFGCTMWEGDGKRFCNKDKNKKQICSQYS